MQYEVYSQIYNQQTQFDCKVKADQFDTLENYVGAINPFQIYIYDYEQFFSFSSDTINVIIILIDIFTTTQ